MGGQLEEDKNEDEDGAQEDKQVVAQGYFPPNYYVDHNVQQNYI